MTSRQNLESFLNELAYLFLTVKSTQSEIECSGIDFDDLNRRGFLGAEAIHVYKTHCKTKSHELSLSETSQLLALVEREVDRRGISQIPIESAIIREKFTELWSAFELDEFSRALQKAATPDEKKKLFETMRQKSIGGVESASIAEIACAYLPGLFEQAKAGKSIKTIPGFELLSKMIGGFNPKRIGMLMASTGFGKTNFAINLALSAARTMAVSYINMEMSFEDMLRRVAVIKTKTTYRDFYRGNFDLESTLNSLSENGQKFTLTSGRALSLNTIEAWARSQKNKINTELLVVDYDQKIDFARSKDEEWRQIQHALLKLEELSKELNLFVLVLAQVNRQNQISGSFRSTFGAHTVLHFFKDEDEGPIVKAEKNRHGKQGAAIKLSYAEETSVISECGEYVHIAKPEKQIEFKKRELRRMPYAE